MAASVNPVQRRQEKRDYGFDLLLKGIDIAANAYGQSLNRDQQNTLAAETAKRAKDANSTAEAIEQKKIDIGITEKEKDRIAEMEREKLRGQNAIDLARVKSFQEGRIANSSSGPSQDSNKPKGKQITASEAGTIGAMESVDKALDTVWRDYQSQASGRGSGIASLIPGSESKLFENSRTPAAQVIGSVLEGGKLSDADAERYRGMLPSPWDSNNEAEAKIKAIKELAKIKIEGQVAGLRKSGFDTEGFDANKEGFKPVAGIESQGMNSANAGGGMSPGTIFNKGGKRYQVNADGKTATELP